jgi:GAF domain-containing protein
LAISARKLDDLLKRTVTLIVERFGYYNASIFLVDKTGENLFLAESSGAFSEKAKDVHELIPVGGGSLAGWVAEHNQARISADIRQEFFYRMDDLLTDTLSEACIPISSNLVISSGISPDENDPETHKAAEELLGVLDVQHDIVNAFDGDGVVVLQTIANHIASVVQNIHLLEISRKSSLEATTLFNASHRLSRAKTKAEVFAAVNRTLEETNFPVGLLVAHGDEMRVVSVRSLKTKTGPITLPLNQPPPGESTSNPRLQKGQVDALFPSGASVVVLDLTQPTTYPQPILLLTRQLACSAVALIPIRLLDEITALMLIGISQDAVQDGYEWEKFSKTAMLLGVEERNLPELQAYVSLAELTSTALEKVSASETLFHRIAALQAFNTISHLVSTKTDLQDLYQKIHSEVNKVLGNIDFIIAIYNPISDTIEIPYMFELDSNVEQGHLLSVNPFPLGQGLTSILIKSQKSLLINEDAEDKARQLGAIIIGTPAKAWLGVPLIIGGEVIGAVIVQDREHENRFSEDDKTLLEILAAQMAVAIRNAKILESSSEQAERERLLFEITNKIRSETNMQSIISTTATELRKAIRAKRARIQVDVDLALPASFLDSHS